MAEQKKALIERLFSQHRNALQAFFYRRVRTKPEVPDLVQEVYLRMLRVKDIDAIHTPEGYLYTVASNLLTEHAVLDRRQAAATDLDQPAIQAELSRSVGFEELLDTQARVRRLREVLEQLPPKCRAAVFMKYRHGLNYQQIAEQLGVSDHMVQKYLGQALAHCRRRMARLR
jgi:RNA polymerase sigma-70 factor (ECF subfamily)